MTGQAKILDVKPVEATGDDGIKLEAVPLIKCAPPDKRALSSLNG